MLRIFDTPIIAGRSAMITRDTIFELEAA